jgi:hypothetical protein
VALKKRKCKNCNNVFHQLKPLQYLCGKLCEQEYSKKLKDKKKQKDPNKTNVSIEKGLNELRNDAREVFQKWIRLRDAKFPCISCGTEKPIQWDGGHFFKAEIYSGLIFNEDNCHKQCSTCNNDDGRFESYKRGLIDRYGILFYNTLVEVKDRCRIYKYSKEELIEISEIYKQKIKELTK